MPMDDFTAIGIAEGFEDFDSEEQFIEAWQHLHTSGLAYSLQGRLGRTAAHMLEQGLIK